jgi:hypothetical protein
MYFAEATRATFSFLEAAGFRISESDSTHVTYTSHRSAVTIAWDVRSGELSVLFGLNASDNQPAERISLTDLLAAEGADAAGPFQVPDESKLTPFLVKLAQATRDYAQPALAGDRMFYRRLQTSRNVQAQVNMRNVEIVHVRADAEVAWRRRDFASVVALYRSIECDLTAAEKAKLAFAMRHQRR